MPAGDDAPRITPEPVDGNREIYVFGYASLVSPESVELTLGHEVDRSKVQEAELHGWSRAWNVGSDHESHPERTFLLADGRRFDGVTVVLGIERVPAGSCHGAVFPVDRRDLELLDVRERNYDRVDVTRDVTWPGKAPDCVVFTYVPHASAVSRLQDAIASGRPVNIRQGYADLVEGAFARLGRLELYRSTTSEASYDRVAMEIRFAVWPGDETV
jgi:cation transport regulator ChaC